MLALSHLSALRALASLSSSDDLAHARRVRLPDAYRVALPAGIETTMHRYDLERPLDAVELGSNTRSSSMLVRHRMPAARDAYSFLMLEKGLYCSSPELCLAQLCGTLDLVDAARLLSWMGGGYGIGIDHGLTRRVPLVDEKTLTRRLERLGGIHGIKLARRISRYIPLGSASPVESSISVAFSLPVEIGGCGLSGMELNAPIELAGEEWALTGATRIRPDFLWRNQLVAVEYDSDAFHVGADRLERDAIRRNSLVNKGLIALTLTRRQLFDFESYETFARQLRIYLGHIDQRSWSQHRSDRRRLHDRLFHSGPSQALESVGFGAVWC